MPAYRFQSARVGLRPWEDADAPFFAALNADPAVMAHFPAPLTEAESFRLLEQLRLHEAEHKCTYWAAVHLDSGQPIGMAGLKRQEYPSPFTPHTDIGWRLMPAYWGQGLATEAAQACLRYAWEVLGLEEVRSVAPLANAPSIRVMERLGMRRLGVFDHPALVGYPHLQACACYGIGRPSGPSIP